jgi:hypothetical protein
MGLNRLRKNRFPPQQASLLGTPAFPPQQASLLGTPAFPPQQASLLGTPAFPPQQASLLGTPAFAANEPSIPLGARSEVIHLLTPRSLLRRVFRSLLKPVSIDRKSCKKRNRGAD